MVWLGEGGASTVSGRPEAGLGEGRPPGSETTRYDELMKVRTWHFDAALAGIFAAASLWLFWVAKAQAASAVREYGYNVDSGAIPYAVALVFFMPVAVLFVAAAVVGSRGWRFGRSLHWLAIAAAVCPIAYEFISSVSK